MSKKEKEMKLNRFEIVKNQMNPSWGNVELPKTLKIGGKKDEECYIVAIIDRLHNAKSENYETVLRIVKYRFEAYVSMKEHFERAGIKNMFILHDPTLKPLEELKEGTAMLTIAEAIKLLKTSKTIEELDLLTSEDTRKSILKAVNEKIEELKGL